MYARSFVEVVNRMLEHIPEDDALKSSLIKLSDNYIYMAPEITHKIWGIAQKEIMKRFDKTSALDLPNWALTILKIWADKEST
jgi:hypothetical protein